MRAEWHEENKAFFGIKGFPETFKKTYEVTLEVFICVMVELLTRCYNSNEHQVGMWALSDLTNDKLFTKKFSSQDIKQIIGILSSEKKRKTKTPSILSIGNLILTNLIRLHKAHISFPQYCFDDFYEEGLKGPVFEEACRKAFPDRFRTVPSCVKINEPMLPLNKSLELWGKPKGNTDLDVIAAFGNFIIILECKQIKAVIPREREINQFVGYIKEMFWRAKWVSSNLEKFKNYVGNAWDPLHIDIKQAVTIIPLVVSNNAVDAEITGYPPLITFNELKELLSVEIFVKPKAEIDSLRFRIGSKDIHLMYMTGVTAETEFNV